MSRRLTTLLLICLLSCMALGQGADRPNVILIATDDLNTWIEPLGSSMARTPNLDRLAAQGVTFTNAHTAGIYCAPSRSAIFTGRYASTTGCYSDELYFYDHPEYRPLQQAFKQGGYKTFGTGKLFHHPAGCLDQRGWSEFFVRNAQQKTKGWPMDSWETVSLVDTYATLLERCALSPDAGLDGTSLVSALQQPGEAKDRSVLLPYHEPNSYAIINRDWRYIHYKDASEELYDLSRDPLEWSNLAQNSEFDAMKTRLKSEAPRTFAPSGTAKKTLRMEVQGQSFRWKTKK